MIGWSAMFLIRTTFWLALVMFVVLARPTVPDAAEAAAPLADLSR